VQYGDRLIIADGAVQTPDGERFPIRVVDWPAAKADAAMLAANNPHVAGDWTAGLANILAGLPEDLGELFAGLQLDVLRDDAERLFAHSQPYRTLAEQFVVPPFSVLDAGKGTGRIGRRRGWRSGYIASLGGVRSRRLCSRRGR